MSPKEIAEKIIKKGDNIEWEIFCVNNAPELARAYLELENKQMAALSIMSEYLKPEQWKLFLNKEFAEWRVCQGKPYNDNDIVKVIELEPTMRLMDELAEVITSIENSYGDDMYGHGLTEALEKYKKFKEALK